MPALRVMLPVLSQVASDAAPGAPGGGPGLPVFPDDAYWVALVIGGIVVILLAAAVLGPLYRSMLPEDPPELDRPPTAGDRPGVHG